MEARILQQPWTERYWGPAPSWIKPGRAMVILRRAMLVEITEDDGTVWVLEVPVGYVSDRATVPWIARLVVLPAGDLELASFPHDLVYSHGGRYFGKNKEWGDLLFRAVLEATPTEIPGWHLTMAHAAVKLGGDGGWKDGWADWPSAWG